MGKSIDLHGYSVAEAMREFVRFYNLCLAKGYRGSIEVIHGYGSSGTGGGIGRELRRFLQTNANKLEQVTEGDDIANPGVTIVYPRQRLPEQAPVASQGVPLASVESAIRRFCVNPKTESKIITKLCGRYGDNPVRIAIREMVKSGALQKLEKDGQLFYRAT